MATRQKPPCLDFKKLFTRYSQLSIFVHSESVGVGSESNLVDGNFCRNLRTACDTLAVSSSSGVPGVRGHGFSFGGES